MSVSLDLLAWLAEDLAHWQIFKCHINQAVISQQLPMKLIYHYEHLSNNIKITHPLQDKLLKQFDKLLTREEFAHLLNLDQQQVAKPYQLKFTGKLIVFTENPEIALRLHWTNTLKAFEAIYHQDLLTAIQQGFHHWQFIDNIEIISKNPNINIFAEHENLSTTWQNSDYQNFELLPSPIAIDIQQLFHQSNIVEQKWLPHLQEQAIIYAKENFLELIE